MALARRKPTETVEKEFDGIKWGNLEKGEHEGRLVMVADLGLQENVYKGEFKGNFQQVALGIEIIGKGMTLEDGNTLPRILWTKPFYVYDKMGEKGTEFKHYSMFDSSAQPETVPDWDSQLGKPISVFVEHVNGKGDKAKEIYDNISRLIPIPEKYQGGVGPAICQTIGIGNCDEEDNAVNKALFGLAKHVFDKRVIPQEKKEDPSSKVIIGEPVAEGVEDPFNE